MAVKVCVSKEKIGVGPLIMSISNLDERIELARSNNPDDTNCIGTALFISGLQNIDEYLESYDVELLLSNLKTADKPQAGDLVTFEAENSSVTPRKGSVWIWHAGVSIGNGKIIHRDANNILSTTLDILQNRYKDYKMRIYRPNGNI